MGNGEESVSRSTQSLRIPEAICMMSPAGFLCRTHEHRTIVPLLEQIPVSV